MLHASLVALLTACSASRDPSQLCPRVHHSSRARSTAYSEEADSPLQHVILGWEKPSHISPKHCRLGNCLPRVLGLRNGLHKCCARHLRLALKSFCCPFHLHLCGIAIQQKSLAQMVTQWAVFCTVCPPRRHLTNFYSQENMLATVWWALLPSMAQRISRWVKIHF